MDGYDSDSSGAGNDSYTETNVLLGYPSKEPTGDSLSHLGGLPVRFGSARMSGSNGLIIFADMDR
jgi:pre-rRNA-processing protein TSR4